jgi:hypothetical protein
LEPGEAKERAADPAKGAVSLGSMTRRRRTGVRVAVALAAAVGLTLVVVVGGAGLAALLLLGAWAGRLTAHCMALPMRSDFDQAARSPSG